MFVQIRISVVIANLNRAPFLRGAIDSVLKSRIQEIECVVVDGLSNDGSLELLEQAKKDYGEALVFISERDSGPSDAYNKGLKLAKGNVLVCLGADDFVAEGALPYVASYFQKHPDHYALYGECEIIDLSGRRIGRYAVKDFSLSVQLNEGCCIQFPSCYYRKAVFSDIGEMDTNDLYADLDWIARVAGCYTFYRVDRTLSRFRFHEGGLTGSTWNTELPRALFRLNRKYGGHLFSTVGRRYMRTVFDRFFLWGKWVKSRIRKMDWHESNMNESYVVFGAALTGYSCMQSLEKSGRNVVGFLDNYPPLDGQYCGLPVLKPIEFMSSNMSEVSGVVVATGGYPFAMKKQLKRLGWHGPVFCYSMAREHE